MTVLLEYIYKFLGHVLNTRYGTFAHAYIKCLTTYCVTVCIYIVSLLYLYRGWSFLVSAIIMFVVMIFIFIFLVIGTYVCLSIHSTYVNYVFLLQIQVI